MLGGQSGLVDYSDSESDDDGQVQFDWKASLASAAPEVGSTSGHAAGSSVAQQVAEEMALALDIAPPADVLHPMLRTDDATDAADSADGDASAAASSSAPPAEEAANKGAKGVGRGDDAEGAPGRHAPAIRGWRQAF